MDVYDSATRSRVMARVKSSDTKVEMVVRRRVHGAGLRFRLHVAALPGKPDLVLAQMRTVVFVHGCFWHQHAGCSRATIPASNSAYWRAKLGRNAVRDEAVIDALLASGWQVEVLWECEAGGAALDELVTRLLDRRARQREAR
ncbi:MAG: DNA mismatch endonuclease Vsr [Dehalococcoidia bacterium]|nr:DNA mismatch endonuclease Vsr [Dehalococcoidia bacterium]